MQRTQLGMNKAARPGVRASKAGPKPKEWFSTMNINDTSPDMTSGYAAPRVDIDAIRETVESGEVTKHRAEDQLIELCDELEQAREMHAKLRALYDNNVASLIAQLDAAHDVNDRIIAVNARLAARVVELGGAA